MTDSTSKTESPAPAVSEAAGAKYMLDLSSLQRKAEKLPAAMREAFLWLGTYCREECAGDVTLLHEQFLALKIEHAVTSWQKIIRGQYCHDAAGNPSNPVIAESKFLAAVAALQNDAKTRLVSGGIGFVMTPTAETIFNYIDLKRAPARVNKFGMIIGETGTQKSASTIEYKRRLSPFAVHIEAPHRPSANLLAEAIAECYGYSNQNTFKRKDQYLLKTVTNRSVIIIENVQRIYDARLEENQQGFSLLQRLQEETRCCIVLTLTPVAELKMLRGPQKTFFEQFVGRCGGWKGILRLREYPTLEDVLTIAQAYGLKDAAKHLGTDKKPGFLTELAREDGRIRPYFEYLQDAKIEAEAKKQAMTIEHVMEAYEKV